MSWRKHFRPVNSILPVRSSSKDSGYASLQNYNSWLPEYYQGPANRLQRYVQYDQMDYDHEVHAALNTLSEFCTQIDEDTMLPFVIKFHEEPSASELKVLQEYLKKWCKINQFSRRIFRIFRSTLKYGDQFFIRDPETKELLWVDPANVEKVVVNESKGKVPEVYFIKNIDLNIKNKVASNNHDSQSMNNSIAFPSMPNAGGTMHQSKISGVGNSGAKATEQAMQVGAEHIFHVSLTEGLDDAWPFGVSELEKVFKVYKQKELLEDSVLIYRIHRAPERRIFTIDVGTMPPQMAQQYLERVKHEVQQKRIPTRSGSGQSIVDASYNPMCLNSLQKIKLANGSTKSLVQIIDDYNNNVVNYAVSQNNEPSKILWAGYTRLDAEVVKITLSTNEEVIATPDHRFILRSGKEIQAKDLRKYNSLMTNKNKDIFVMKNELMNQKIDTCDITVDHSTHTFELDSEILVHNSMLEDYYFTCLSLNQKILLLDGRSLSLQEIIKEYNEGKENFVYSQDKNQKLEPGKIFWAGVTRKNAKIMKVTLDNNETITCTPDHRFILRNGSEIEAQYLKVNDSLMPLYLNYAKTSATQEEADYVRYTDNNDGKIKWVHTAICPKSKPGKEIEIHHIDFNSRNNNPTNLIEMTYEEHRELHSKHQSEKMTKRCNDPDSRKVLIESMKNTYSAETRTEEIDKMIRERNHNNAIAGWNNKTPEEQQQWRINSRNGTIKARQKFKINFSIETFNRIEELFNEGFNSIPKMTKILKNDSIFQDLIKQANPELKRNKNNSQLISMDDSSLNRAVNVAGYSTWGEYRSKKLGISIYHNYNHKILSIEFLDYTEDTGDITIETKSGSHIFALAAGVFIHNSSADGRGSKVETLPGGEALGEISDLRYFNNKMLRALGIPSSYLPTGPEDGTDAYNDGRVGTAFIQEFRFQKTCKRLQSLLSPAFDEEFKKYLDKSGVTVENNLFEIDFTEPQNFSQYRQIELDQAFVQVYSGVVDNPIISKRFALKRYLGWTQKDILENEQLLAEELAIKGNKTNRKTQANLRQVGLGGGDLSGGNDFQGDLGGEESLEDLGTETGADMNNPTPNLTNEVPLGPQA